MTYSWRYRCSICRQIVHPDDVREHTDEEKAKPTWPGRMSWTRVDPSELTALDGEGEQ